MVVMDVKGAGLSHLSGDVLRYLKTAGDINSQHYPLTMKRAFVVNSPFWLAGVWSKMKGILPESVQVEFVASDMTPLHEYIDPEQIPTEYGGTSPYRLGEHPYESELKTLVDEYINASPEEKGLVSPRRNEVRQIVSLDRPVSPLPTSPVVRRRLYSPHDQSRLRTRNTDSYNAGKGHGSQHYEVFVAVSILHCMWSMMQGALETSIPLWILSPTSIGGLGYTTSMSGLTIFGSCLALFWMLRTRQSRLVSGIPAKEPLRALRIGTCGQAALLVIFFWVSNSRR